jgi:hypothetical protein
LYLLDQMGAAVKALGGHDVPEEKISIGVMMI